MSHVASAAPARANASPSATARTAPARPPSEELPPEWQEAPAYDALYEQLVESVPQSEGLTRADEHENLQRVIDRARNEAGRSEAKLVASRRLQPADAKRLRALSKLILEEGRSLSDAWEWASGPTSSQGADRSDTWLGSTHWYAVGEFFLLRSLESNDVDGYAEFVRANALRDAGGRRTLSRLRRLANHWLPLAPEAALPDPSCITVCLLGGVDYLKRLRELDAFEANVEDMAQLVCRVWPDLATRFKNADACAHALEVHSVATLPWSPEKPDDEEGLSSWTLPPARDPSYAKFADPVHLGCLLDENGRQRQDRAVGACLLRARERGETAARRQKSRLVATLERAVALSKTLCELDSLAGMANVPGQGFDHCDWLADLRLAYLANAIVTGSSDGFASHVRFRSAWGERIRASIARTPEIVALAPCGEFDFERCRPTHLSDAGWKKQVLAAQQMVPSVESWAKRACADWGELDAALGADCPQLMQNYLFSFGLNVLGEDDD